MAYQKGDRVQATLFFIKSRQHRHSSASLIKTEATVGIFDGYKGQHSQVTHCFVRWLTGKPYPPEIRQVVQLKYIEPLGTPR